METKNKRRIKTARVKLYKERQTNQMIQDEMVGTPRISSLRSESLRGRRASLERHSKSFVNDSLFYRPIFKAITGCYTREEWEVILKHSVHKSADLGRHNRYSAYQSHIMKLEHLSHLRLK